MGQPFVLWTLSEFVYSITKQPKNQNKKKCQSNSIESHTHPHRYVYTYI